MTSYNHFRRPSGVNGVWVGPKGSEVQIADGTGNIIAVDMDASGDATVGGTLDVTGNTTVGGTLGVTGAVTLSSDLTVNGDITYGDTYWDDLRGPAEVLRLGTAGNPSFNETTVTLDFDKNTNEYVFFTFQMPHRWKEGSTIYPHVHWMPKDTDTGVVAWQMQYKWTNIGDTQSGTFSSLIMQQAADGTALKHQIIGNATGIDGTGKTISSVIQCVLHRLAANAGDTYDNDAGLIEFDIHYEIDTPGSDSELVK